MSINDNLILQFKELRNAVNQSSEHTKRQIDTIDPNPFLGGVISIIAVLGISYLLQIFVYWIPTGFVLLLLLSLKSLKPVFRPLKKERVESTLEMVEKVEKSQMLHGVKWIFRNLDPIIKSLAIIYAISFFIILAINNGWINVKEKFNVIIPLITCLLYIITPFSVDNLAEFFNKERFIRAMENLGELKNKRRKFLSVIIF